MEVGPTGKVLAKSIPDTQLFRDAFDASPIGIAVENLDGQPLFVNPALCAMLGFSEGELRGNYCVQFSPPDDAKKDWAPFQTLRAGSIGHYQMEVAISVDTAHCSGGARVCHC